MPRPYNPTFSQSAVGDGIEELQINIFPFELEQAKLKLPFVPPMSPAPLATAVGLALLSWSSIERQFDEVLAAIISTNGNQPNDAWKRMGFKRRCALFKTEMKPIFENHPNIMKFLRQALGDCKILHWKRNALAHGRCAVSFEIKNNPGTELATITPRLNILANRGAIQEELNFSEDDLQDLYYELGHLNGRLAAIIDPLAGLLPLPYADREFLENWRGRNRPSPPTESTLADPPEASQE